MDQNSQNIALIKKKKTLGTATPTLSFNFIFYFLGHFSIRCIYYFSKKCWLFWDGTQNMLFVRGAVPP